MLFDLIITAFNSGEKDFEHRCSNLKKSLETIPNDVHVIIVEQTFLNMPTFIDSLESIPPSMTTHKIGLNKPFNKAWLYNYATKKLAQTENFIFGETDILFPENYFSTFAQYLEANNKEWSLGWNKMNFLTLDGKPSSLMPNLTTYSIDSGGGCWGQSLFIKKNLFYKIGGFNEFLQGASVVDNDIAARLIRETGVVNRFNCTLDHLYHDRHQSAINWGTDCGRRYHYVLDNPDTIAEKLSKVFDEAGGDIPLFYKKPGYLVI